MVLKCTVFIQSMIIEKIVYGDKEIFHIRFFQELLLVFKTNRFMTVNPVYFEQDDLLEGKKKFFQIFNPFIRFSFRTIHITFT